MLNPEFEFICLEERVSKGIEKIVGSKGLEMSWTACIFVWHSWWLNRWFNFTLVLWEEKSSDSKLKISWIDFWGIIDRPVKIHMVINLCISLFITNKFVNGWRNLLS